MNTDNKIEKIMVRAHKAMHESHVQKQSCYNINIIWIKGLHRVSFSHYRSTHFRVKELQIYRVRPPSCH